MKGKVEKVLRYIDENSVVNLTKNMIKIPNPSWEETELAQFLACYMEKIGMEVELQDVRKNGHVSKQVIGKFCGTGDGPSLMFCGHIDSNISRRQIGYSTTYKEDKRTGFYYIEPESWTKDPFRGEIENGWLYGIGVANMKAGNAAMITAAYAVNKASSLKGDITVAALMGELSGNVGVRHMLKKGVTADIAIVTDCSDLAIVPSEVGKIEGRIVVEGKPDLRHTHINSIEKMYKVINAFGPNYRPIDTDGWVRFKPCDDLPGYPRIAPLAIESPYPGNFCALTFRLITVPGQSIETVRGDLERLMDKLRSEDPDFKAEIKLMEEESTPACYTSTDEPIVRTLAKWHEYVTGEKPKIGAGLRLGWSSVTGYLWKARMKTVSYGPGETPGIDERVKVEDIVTATKAMALTAAEICA